MRRYQEVRLVMVLLDEGQTLSNELSFHFLTTNDNLHPGLQVKNAAICLHAMRKSWMPWFYSDSSKNLTGTGYRAPYPQFVKTFWDV